jgi:cytochrome c
MEPRGLLAYDNSGHLAIGHLCDAPVLINKLILFPMTHVDPDQAVAKAPFSSKLFRH